MTTCFNTNFCPVKEALPAAVFNWHFYWLSVHESIKNKKHGHEKIATLFPCRIGLG